MDMDMTTDTILGRNGNEENRIGLVWVGKRMTGGLDIWLYTLLHVSALYPLRVSS
jgi:hypothetical protein